MKEDETLTKESKLAKVPFKVFDVKNAEIIEDKDMVLSKETITLAIIGNVDSGKSTLCGVLTMGLLDDGRGLARSRVAVHNHELTVGRTSCISERLVGFHKDGALVTQAVGSTGNATAKDRSYKNVVKYSSKLLRFVDLAGHEKYYNTTCIGMSGYLPDYSLVVVGSARGVQKMTKQHIILACCLRIPLFVVITKVDDSPIEKIKRTKKQVKKLLGSKICGKKGFEIKEEKDLDVVMKDETHKLAGIFMCDSVSGKNYDLLVKYLRMLKPKNRWEKERAKKGGEFLVENTYVCPGIGTVVGGLCRKGKISADDKTYIGPFKDGGFRQITIRSIHCNRLPTPLIKAGESGGIAVRYAKAKGKETLKRNDIHRGMVVITEHVKRRSAILFEADVFILHHPTTIRKGYQVVLHAGGVRQTAKIEKILEIGDEKQSESTDKEDAPVTIRTGDKAKLLFRLLKRPEFIKKGMRLVGREGNATMFGVISKCEYIKLE